MTARRLHVWSEDQYVGFFDETSEGIQFRYAENAAYPISLSLPLNGVWPRRNPGLFLENLLPEGEEAKETMRRAVGAADATSFSLLNGADATGGLVFSLLDEPPVRTGMGIVLTDENSIARRIAAMRSTPSEWWESDSRIRFSLAGNQPKFSLVRIGNRWANPNAANPSTHILKPAPLGDEGDRLHGTRDADVIEAASMRLVALCGIEVPTAGVMSFVDEPAYIVERFDRYERDDGSIGRIHTEDMMQSLGLPPHNKYSVKAKDILRVLHAVDTTDTLSYAWIQQLAMNVSISNADAHAKNYSIMLRPNGIRLSPMYDVLTTTYWPKVSRLLPMSIGGANGSRQITPHHWERLAIENNLDSERVVHIARATAGLVLSHASEAYANLPAPMRNTLLSELAKANERIEPTFPN